jgi:hypothetical protein
MVQSLAIGISVGLACRAGVAVEAEQVTMRIMESLKYPIRLIARFPMQSTEDSVLPKRESPNVIEGAAWNEIVSGLACS